MNGRLIRGSDFTGLNAPAQSVGSYYRVQLLSSGRFRIAKNIGGSFDSWNDFLTNADMKNYYNLLMPEILIPNSSDLNDYTTPGQYYTPSASASQTIQNTPYKTTGFKLIVENLSSTQHVLQTMKAVNGEQIFFRTASVVSGSYQWNGRKTPMTEAVTS